MLNNMRDKLVNLINQDNCPSPFMCSNECKYAHLKNCSGDRLADHLIENGVILQPCKPGDDIWVVEDDDVTGYMFLAKSKGCIIATSWINDYDLDETIEYHIEETENNYDTRLVVFPEDICFASKEEAEARAEGLR